MISIDRSRKLKMGLLFLFLFVVLALVVKSTVPFPVDHIVGKLFVKWRSAPLTYPAIACSFLGSSFAIGAGLAAVLIGFWNRDKQLALFIAVSTIMLAFGVEVIKVIVAEPRPGFALFPEINLSFPSSHTAVSAYFYGWIWVLSGRIEHPKFRNIARWSIPVLVLCISLSRLYVGAHWLRDLAGGYLLGIGMLLILVSQWKSMKFYLPGIGRKIGEAKSGG